MSDAPRRPLSAALVATARSLAVDAVTAQVVGALGAAGVRSVVLKGPALASWLYDDGAPRAYGDTDVLVSPADRERAEAVLLGLGFEPEVPGGRPQEVAPHSNHWVRRADGARVDLHHGLLGAAAGAERVWAVLSARTQRMRVGGVELEVLDPPARAMHVATHAAQHGPATGKPLEDLARALRRLPLGVWREAAAVAREVGAEAAMGAGLRLLGAGAELARDLGLPPEVPAEVELRARSAPQMSVRLQELASQRGLGAKLRYLARELVPTPGFMRYSSRLARRGPVGLGLAYLVRPFSLAGRFPRAFREWRSVRRGGR